MGKLKGGMMTSHISRKSKCLLQDLRKIDSLDYGVFCANINGALSKSI